MVYLEQRGCGRWSQDHKHCMSIYDLQACRRDRTQKTLITEISHILNVIGLHNRYGSKNIKYITLPEK